MWTVLDIASEWAAYLGIIGFLGALFIVATGMHK